MQESKISKVADELGLSTHQVQQVIDKLLAKGVISQPAHTTEPSVVEQWETEFAAVKQSIKRRDVYTAAREARQHSHRLLEDQGLASLSIVFAHLLAELMEEPDRILEMVP